MRKILAIAWKEVYLTFTNRNLLIIMLLSPLAVSTIVGLAFGGSGTNDVPIRDIPVAIVNLDQGNDAGVNYGDIFVGVLVPGEDAGVAAAGAGCDFVSGSGTETGSDEPNESILHDLTDSVVFDLAAAEALIAAGEVQFASLRALDESDLEPVARLAVENDVYAAAIIIPPDFSERAAYIPFLHPELEETGITVYASGASPISAGVINSIAGGIAGRIAAGNIAMAAAFSGLEARYGARAVGTFSPEEYSTAFACAFNPGTDLVSLRPESVQGEAGIDTTTAILVSVGSAQAMFFAMFTAQFGVLGMHQEKREWTLQRLVVSPTPRSHILAGNLVGVFVTVVFQVVILVIALTIVASLLAGEPTALWGTDLLRLALLILAVALGVSGFSMLLAGIVRSAEQGQIVGPVANMVQGVMGGAFGFFLPTAIAVFSLIYWGREAFQELALGTGDIGLNLTVLAVAGVVLYVIGVVLFNRRIDL